MVVASVVLVACGGGGGGQQTETVEVTIGPGAAADTSGDRQGAGGNKASNAAKELPGNCPDETLEPTEENLAKIERATFCLLNAVRRKNGLGELERNEQLAEAATAHTMDMVERKYFAHVSPDGTGLTKWIRGTGYIPESGGWKAGENIGWAARGAAQPARLVAGWMDSPTHRDNILDGDFVHIGLGVAHGVPEKGAKPGATYTTVFGAQKNRG